MERRAQAVYVAGGGTLLGRGARWLLVDAPPDRLPVERLWAILAESPGHPGAGGPVLALLEAHFDGHLPSLVLLDQTPGAEEVVVRGRGQVAVRPGIRAAAVGLPAAGQRLPLVEGVVAAAGVELATPAVRGTADPGPVRLPHPADPAAPPGPDHSATPVRRPDTVPARRPAPAPATPRHTPRRGAPRVLPPRLGAVVSPALPPAPPPPQTPAATEQEPVPVPRPALGGLRLPGGQVIPLDRGVVFGRRPEPVPGGDHWPHLVHLPPGSSSLSRVHLQIELEGGQVVARDLGSRGGTTVAEPGRRARPLTPGEPHVLERGQVLSLGGTYDVVYEIDG